MSKAFNPHPSPRTIASWRDFAWAESAVACLRIKPETSGDDIPIRIEVAGKAARTLLLPTHNVDHVGLQIKGPAKVSVGNAARIEKMTAARWWLNRISALGLGDPILKLPIRGAVICLRTGGRQQRKALRKDLKTLKLFGIGPQMLCADSDAGLVLGFANSPPPPYGDMPPTVLRIGVVVHLHYTDVWPDIEATLLCIPQPFGLIVTTTDRNEALEQAIKARFPNADVRTVPNSGRDVRPFLKLLDSGDLDNFDLVCKLHGKKSLRNGRATALGDLWRRSAFYDLVAGPGRLTEAVTLFEKNARLGLLGPQRFRIPNDRFGTSFAWSGNRQETLRIADELNLPGADDLDFFAGTMFWLRPAALAPLRGAKLGEPATYAPEAGRTDGAVEHAVERLFGTSAKAAGFTLGALSPLPEA